MKSFTATLVAAIGLLTSVHAQELTGVDVQNFTYAGTGCPQGSLIAYKTLDNNRTVIVFDPLQAFIGPYWPITEARDTCQINLDIKYPKGYQYAVQSTTYSGTTDLQKGVTALLKATYYFSGSAVQQSASSSFVGPQHNQWTATEWISTVDRLWSDCTTPLPINILTQVRLSSTVSGASGTIATDGRYDIQLVWRKC